MSCLGVPGALTVFQFLPVALTAQTSLKKGRNKTQERCPVAVRLDCVGRCGAGSTLTAHYHPSAPVVGAAAADVLYSSPPTGYRSADSWSACVCNSVCVCVSVMEQRTDGGGSHSTFHTAAADSFTPAVWRCLISSCHGSLCKDCTLVRI